MRRKIIKQGVGGSTIFLPVKWIRDNNLKPGDEISIQQEDNTLVIAAEDVKEKKREISFSIADARESAVRTLLVNVYRSGFDKMTVKYKAPEKRIVNIVESLLVGFDLYKSKTDTYVIESISEPDYENFENIIRRQLYMVESVISNVLEKNIEQDVNKVQRYDNFLKRCISKKKLEGRGHPLLWQFLSNLTQIARSCIHFQKALKAPKKDDKLALLIQELHAMCVVLRKAYLTRDVSELHLLHKKEQEIVHEKNLFADFDPLIAHHIITIARVIYLANSPLAGWIQVNSLNS